jgi:hypothetical protein
MLLAILPRTAAVAIATATALVFGITEYVPQKATMLCSNALLNAASLLE